MFIFSCLVLVIGSVVLFKRFGVKNSFSKGVALAIALSILAVVALAQNYTQSLIPEANDGMGISNSVAYWIIGEERWTNEMFQSFFEKSTYLTLVLIVAYPLVLAVEARKGKKTIGLSNE
ncbi:carbon starvation protein CstA [Bacillus tianshenii]|uniref:Carbon starvation protein CstA n=1 Tax=Sutcliffiella tianshenii TaxID=1463404 RepID=A0ABS2NYE4_9BACI|nr:hypothetical protein [Bacillus tianshenii]MBM7619690.1 carbon starvation protein CstA [Bacillus tianshenii]